MRGLSTALLAKQKAASAAPYLTLTVGGVSYAGRLLELRHAEKPFGGVASIVLSNHDKSLSGADLRGKQVLIGYGYYTPQPEASVAPPLWVLDHQDISHEGRVAVQLDCIDLWHKIGLDVLVSGGVDLKGTVVGYFQPGMWVTGQSSGARARVAYTGQGYIAVTNFITTQSFSPGETVTYDDDPDTTYMTVDSVTGWSGGPGPGWSGKDSILTILTQLLSGLAGVVLDSDDGIITSAKPLYYTQTGASTLQVFEDLLMRTKCGARVGQDGKVHLFSVASDPSPHYTYYRASEHVHLHNIRDRRLVLPNRVTVYNSKQQKTGTVAVIGVAEDEAAKNQYGAWVDRIVDIEAQTGDEANQVAGSLLRKAQMEAVTGTIEAPMNCGQELLDYIRVEDDRSNVVFQGWVGSITRLWKPGTYTIELGLGGLTQAEMIPMPDMPMPNFPTPDVLPSFIPLKPPRDIGQGEKIALIDIVFYPETWDTFRWDDGYIRFVDGTSQYIQAGRRTMANPVEYLYAYPGSSYLHVTPDLANTQSWQRILVAQVNRGLSSIDKVMIIPIRGKVYWDLDSIFDGSGFGRIRKYALSADGLVLLDQVREGVTYGRVKKASLTVDGLVLLDAVVEGTYARVKKAALTVDGLVVMDQVQDGNYAKVRATALLAGQIKLWETVESDQAVKVTSSQRTGAVRAYDFFETKVTAYGVSVASSASWTRTELTATGLRGYFQGNLQFELRASDGRAYCGGGAVVLDAAGIATGGVRINNSGLHVWGDRAIKFMDGERVSGYIGRGSRLYLASDLDIELIPANRVYVNQLQLTELWAVHVHLTGSLNANGLIHAHNLKANAWVEGDEVWGNKLWYKGDSGGWLDVKTMVNDIYQKLYALNAMVGAW